MHGLIVIAAATLFAVTACGASGLSAPAVAPMSSLRDYTVIPDAPLGPATQSATQWDGTSWRFDQPAPGKLTLLYFGYTSCPDVCPTTMADIAVAMRRLPSSITDKVSVQFVSTDPTRDTPTKLHAWIDQFNPAFHAARAPIASVIAAARSYGIFIEKPVVTAHDYQVTHGAQLVVLNDKGGEVGFFGELAPASSYAQALPTLVAKYT